MTDADFLLGVLSDGKWHSRDAILAESFRVRGCGMTVHSRAADLRKRGHIVECDTENNTADRRTSFYRMVVLDSPAATGAPPSAPAGVAGESSASIPDLSPGDAAGRGGALESSYALTLFESSRGAYQEDQ